jgi:catechol 2,3-dioxygenase-like lactoylglutathione lyase family enzyme
MLTTTTIRIIPTSSNHPSTMSTPPTSLTHVLETCLYVKSKPASDTFYQEILGLKPYLSSKRSTIYPLGKTTLLLFQLGLSSEDIHPRNRPEHTIPGHGPSQEIVDVMTGEDRAGPKLKQHFCLAVNSKEEVEKWEQYLKEKEVEILGVMEWEKGGRSVYFADPDGHVGEIGSRGIWSHY